MSAPSPKPPAVLAGVEVRPRPDTDNVEVVITLGLDDALDVALRIVGMVQAVRRQTGRYP